MTSFNLYSPLETMVLIARQARQKRLKHNFAQKTLSERAGVSLSVVKKFEKTGRISLESLVKIACALGSLESFQELFKESPAPALASLDLMIEEPPRKRGRK